MRKKQQREEPVWGVITEKYTTLEKGVMDVYTVTYKLERASVPLSLDQLKRMASFLYGFISKEERSMK